MTDDEREQHIRECSRRFHEAYDAGDREMAYEWLRMQNQAVKERSAARIEEMERCYFCEQGEADWARA